MSDSLRTHGVLGIADSSVGKKSACNAGDPGSVSGSGSSAEDGIGYPLQYYWASLVAQLVKNLPAMWGDLGSIPRLRRSPGEGNWLPTPVFWAGESHELYNPWGHKESDATEQLSLSSERKKTKLIAASHLRGAEQP